MYRRLNTKIIYVNIAKYMAITNMNMREVIMDDGRKRTRDILARRARELRIEGVSNKHIKEVVSGVMEALYG